MDTNEVQIELNKIAFFGCEQIKVGDVLHYSLENPIKGNLLIVILKLLRLSFIASSYDFQQYGESKALMFFSNDYRFRADHLKAFNSVLTVLNNAIAIRPSSKKYSFKGIGRVLLPIRWVKQMSKVVPSLQLRIRYSFTVFSAYIDACEITSKIENSKWRKLPLITYCDVMPTDSFIIQHFNNLGKLTVTLQHGSFNVKTNSWAYLGSHSKVFLAESQAAVDDGISAGYKGNMIPVGSPHNLNASVMPRKSSIENNEIELIGVIMNSPMQMVDDNIQMIVETQEYCKKRGIKLVLKCHPADSLDKYKSIIDGSMTEICRKGVSVEKFAEDMDLVIVSASTAFLTVLNMGIPTFLFVRPGNDPHLFLDTDMLKFSTSDDLDRLIKWRKTSEYSLELNRIKKYLLSPYEIHKCYQDAFKTIGIL